MNALVSRIAAHPFWKGLDQEFLELLIEGTEVQSFRQDEQIFLSGCDAECFYLIERGCVALQTLFMPAMGVVTIQTLGEGEALGWSWLFEPHFWHFSARAIEPTVTLNFNGPRLRQLTATHTRFGRELAMRVATVLQQRLQAVRLRLLENSGERH